MNPEAWSIMIENHEIEAPSTAQIAEAKRRDIIAFAADGGREVDVVSRLVASGVPMGEAKRIAPTIMRASRGTRFRRRLPSLLFGVMLTGVGLFLFVAQIIKKRFHPGPLLLVIAGVAIAAGYIKFKPDRGMTQ